MIRRRPATERRIAPVRSVFRQELRIPDDVPDMSIRILEIAGIPAIERLLGGLDNNGASPASLLHEFVDLVSSLDIVPDRERRRASSGLRKSGVVGDIG